MKSAERILADRYKGSSRYLREVIDLAEDQGWTFRIKADGLLFFPPNGKARLGFEQIFARDPKSDSHQQKVLKDNFRKAGMKFPEEERQERQKTVNTVTPIKPSSPSPQSAIAAAKAKLNEAIDALTDIEGLLSKIETENQGVQRLKDAMKALQI